MARNIELKARLVSLAAARQVAQGLAESSGREWQRDTYFLVPKGRLKLRERQPEGAASECELIAYQRAIHAEARASDYLRVLIASEQAAICREALTRTLGIRCVVEKQREVFLQGEVRIHLDQVTGLGEFLEFEAVLGERLGELQAHEQLASLRSAFALGEDQLVAESYSELMLRT